MEASLGADDAVALALQKVDASKERDHGLSRALTRQIEAVEARLTALVAAQQSQQTASLRESDKLAELTSKSIECRLRALEERQTKFESRLAEAVESGVRGAGGAAGCRAGPCPTAMFAVQELEAVLRSEITVLMNACNSMQDTLNGDVLPPLNELERKASDQGGQLAQISVESRQCTSRLEEHDVRLGVVRTMVDLHDDKFKRLDAYRISSPFHRSEPAPCQKPNLQRSEPPPAGCLHRSEPSPGGFRPPGRSYRE